MRVLNLILLSFFLFGFKADSFFSFETFENNSKLEIDCIIHEEFYDCGEWGGHDEHIVITNINGTFILSYKRDNSSCIFDPKKPFIGVISKEIILNDHEKEIIEKYIAALINHTPNPDIRSNAAGWYKVRYKDKEIQIYDRDNSFMKKHLAFKKKLFN